MRNFATGHDVRVVGSTCEILSIFSEWRSIRDAARLHPLYGAAEVRRRAEALCAEGFLRRSDQPANPADATMSKLDPWNPAVGFFHSATRDVTFASLAAARQEQRAVAAEHPWPGANYLPRNDRSVRLPPPRHRSAVSTAFVRRRSWRRFRRAPLGLQHLSTLLWLTGGVQRWIRTDFGEFALKTSPSGGALHPIELYVLARRVAHLQAGFYHYSGVEHRLRRVRRHVRALPLDRYLPEQPWFEGAAAVVFLVAHYERCLWRYTYPRAYRAPFIEAGHLAQTFCVKATELGLAPFVSMALADRTIEEEIGADGVSRSVLYAAGVGHRPARVVWAPLPDGMGTLRTRINRPKHARSRQS